jgi:hypothetical protein
MRFRNPSKLKLLSANTNITSGSSSANEGIQFLSNAIPHEQQQFVNNASYIQQRSKANAPYIQQQSAQSSQNLPKQLPSTTSGGQPQLRPLEKSGPLEINENADEYNDNEWIQPRAKKTKTTKKSSNVPPKKKLIKNKAKERKNSYTKSEDSDSFGDDVEYLNMDATRNNADHSTKTNDQQSSKTSRIVGAMNEAVMASNDKNLVVITDQSFNESTHHRSAPIDCDDALQLIGYKRRNPIDHSNIDLTNESDDDMNFIRKHHKSAHNNDRSVHELNDSQSSNNSSSKSHSRERLLSNRQRLKFIAWIQAYRKRWARYAYDGVFSSHICHQSIIEPPSILMHSN